MIALLLAATIAVPSGERDVALWALRLGGRVTIEGRTEPLTHVAQLPASAVTVVGLDLFGAHLKPDQLDRLQVLRHLRELHLPAHMWNEGAGVKDDFDDRLGLLVKVPSLRKLDVSPHFLTRMHIKDGGIERLAPLGAVLEELSLPQSQMKGHTLGAFVALRALDLSHGPIDDQGLAQIGKMKRLVRLRLREALITDAGLAHLAGLEALEELDLQGCRLTDAGLTHLKGLRRLRKLNILGASITDQGLDALAGMNQLVELVLYRSAVTNAAVGRLAEKKQLLAVDLRYTRMTGSGVAELRAALPGARIQFVDAGGTAELGALPPEGNDEAMATWARTLGGTAELRDGKLVALTLAATPIGDAHLAPVGRLSHLERIDLGATEVGDVGLRRLGDLPGLREARLDHLPVSDAGLASLERVRKLGLAYTQVRGRALASFAQLAALDLTGAALGAETLPALARLKNLRELCLAYTTVDDRALGLLRPLVAIETLDLAATEVTDAGVDTLGALRALRLLDLRHTRVTEAAVKRLQKALPACRVLWGAAS